MMWDRTSQPQFQSPTLYLHGHHASRYRRRFGAICIMSLIVREYNYLIIYKFPCIPKISPQCNQYCMQMHFYYTNVTQFSSQFSCFIVIRQVASVRHVTGLDQSTTAAALRVLEIDSLVGNTIVIAWFAACNNITQCIYSYLNHHFRVFFYTFSPLIIRLQQYYHNMS